MRDLFLAVLSFALSLSTLFAQSRAPLEGQAASATAKQPLPKPPVALYECDSDQCENPTSGGAVWLFEGKDGQGMWRYNAVTNLTVEQFDGHTIRIHRSDPVGTYSSQFVGGKEFFADYVGTIEGDSIRGTVTWKGNQNDRSTWHATILNWDFCDEHAPKCPLEPEQLTILGSNAVNAKMYDAAYACFRISALARNPDSEGMVALMSMHGHDFQKLSPEVVIALLEDSANHGSYPGEVGLAEAYSSGTMVPKDSEKAAYWNDRATNRQQQREVVFDGQAFLKAFLLGLATPETQEEADARSERAQRAQQQDWAVFQRNWRRTHP